MQELLLDKPKSEEQIALIELKISFKVVNTAYKSRLLSIYPRLVQLDMPIPLPL